MSGSTTAVTASAATTAITLYYTNILQRTPDAAGLAGWVAAVTSGALTLAQVESNFIASPEAINYVDPIITLYTSLGRVPDAAGLAGFVAQLKAGTSLASITNVFLTSVEGQGIYGASPTTSPTAFVATLYQEILGRAPETAGAAYWAGQLTSGAMTAAQVLNAIAASAEATARDATPITNFLTSAGLGTATYTGPLVTTVAAATAVPLTTGLDNLVGGTGNNTFNAIDGGVNGTTPTWTIGDTLVGGSGVNTFNDTSSTAITAVPTSATLSGIQTANFLDAAAVSLITTSGFTGLTALNITDVGSASASVTAAGTTSVSVTTSAEGIFSDTILGGLNDALTVAGVTTGGAIAVGSLTALPLGTITVSVTDANTGTATGSSIATTGGTIVTVTENITAATSTTGNPGVANTDTGGAITVIGGSATTSVTVAQTAPVTAVAGITAVAAATATDTVTWQAFSEAGTQVIGGVTVTSTGGNFSAVQVALVANGGSVSGLSVSGSGTTWSVAQTLVGTGGTSLFTSVVASAPVAIGAGVPSTTANIAPTAVQTAVPTTGGAHGVDTVTWQAFTGAGTQTIGGVTVTSTGAFTATQVATSVATGNNAGVAVPGLTISGIGTTWTVAALGATTSQFTDVTATTGDTLAGSGGQTTTFATAAPTAVAGIIGVAAVAGVTAVGGIADGIVTITDINGTSTTAAGTITTASLNGYAAGSTIVDGALTSLTLAGTGFGLTVSNSLATQTATTLALTLNGLTDTTGFTDATIKTLNVVTGGTSASTLAALTATALTSLNVSGTQTLAISSATPSTSLTAITVSGGAGLSVALAPTTTFTSTSTGTDLVTITAATTQVVTGNGTAAEEIIWNGTSSPAATAYLGSVTGFKVLGIGGLVTGTESFDMSKITGFTGFDVQANGNAYTVNLTKVTAGSPLAIDGTIGTLVYKTADSTGAADSLALSLGTTSLAAGMTVSALTLSDSLSIGLGTVSVTTKSKASAGLALVDTVTALTDTALATLNLAGTTGLTVTNAFTTSAAALTINGTSTGTAGLVFTGAVTDTSLTSLTVSGSNPVVFTGGLADSSASLTVTNSGTSTVVLNTVTDANLASVTLAGKVAATISSSAGVTGGVTIAGGTDNSNVTATLATLTATGNADNINLGNGTNVVSDIGAVVGATVNITVGTGQNTITVGPATDNVVIGTHATTTIDSVSVASATFGSLVPSAIISGLNANGADTITFGNAATSFLAFSTAQLNGYAAAIEGNATPASLQTAIADLINASGGNLSQGAVGEFQYGGNSYLVLQASAAGTAFGAGDTLVKLSGAYALTTASTFANHILSLHG